MMSKLKEIYKRCLDFARHDKGPVISTKRSAWRDLLHKLNALWHKALRPLKPLWAKLQPLWLKLRPYFRKALRLLRYLNPKRYLSRLDRDIIAKFIAATNHFH